MSVEDGNGGYNLPAIASTLASFPSPALRSGFKRRRRHSVSEAAIVPDPFDAVSSRSGTAYRLSITLAGDAAAAAHVTGSAWPDAAGGVHAPGVGVHVRSEVVRLEEVEAGELRGSVEEAARTLPAVFPASAPVTAPTALDGCNTARLIGGAQTSATGLEGAGMAGFGMVRCDSETRGMLSALFEGAGLSADALLVPQAHELAGMPHVDGACSAVTPTSGLGGAPRERKSFVAPQPAPARPSATFELLPLRDSELARFPGLQAALMYSCKYPACSRQFKTKREVRAHVKYDHEADVLQCRTCGRAFKMLAFWIKHEAACVTAQAAAPSTPILVDERLQRDACLRVEARGEGEWVAVGAPSARVSLPSQPQANDVQPSSCVRSRTTECREERESAVQGLHGSVDVQSGAQPTDAALNATSDAHSPNGPPPPQDQDPADAASRVAAESNMGRSVVEDAAAPRTEGSDTAPPAKRRNRADRQRPRKDSLSEFLCAILGMDPACV